MSESVNNCFICDNNDSGLLPTGAASRFLCNHCGEYSISNAAMSSTDLNTSKFKSCAYYYFTHMKKINEKTYLITTTIEGSESDDFNFISIQEILNLYPRNFSKRIDMILLSWEKNIKTISEIITFSKLYEEYYMMFFIDYDPTKPMLDETNKIQKQIKYLIN